MNSAPEAHRSVMKLAPWIQIRIRIEGLRDRKDKRQKLNRELSYLGSCVRLYSLAQTPLLPPPPSHLGSYTRALLVSQDRRHLFVTLCWIQIQIRTEKKKETVPDPF
jgi:hypothetical protein